MADLAPIAVGGGINELRAAINTGLLAPLTNPNPDVVIRQGIGVDDPVTLPILLN